MKTPKVSATDYINFLVATPRAYSCTEAARVQPVQDKPPAHDAFTRLLHRLETDSRGLWEEAQGQVRFDRGLLVLDDSTLDKLYGPHIGLVTRHWSGKHRQVVQGINLLSLLWTDGERHIPCDYRLYDKANDHLSKNDHFQALLKGAQARGFHPYCVAFDSWYASLSNLKLIQRYGWTWLTQLKPNRLVSPERQGKRPLAACDLAESGTSVHLQGYGLIRVFLIVAPNGDKEYWATNDLQMSDLDRLRYSDWAWLIEHYHRGIKQFCGIERCQARSAHAQRTHIGLALRAFLRLEAQAFKSGFSWFALKHQIIRDAVRAYLAHPIYLLSPSA